MDDVVLLTATVAGLQVGQPAVHVDERGREYVTGIWKAPVEGDRWLSTTGFDGDGQADLVNHGGADKAALAYAATHYPGWRHELAIDAMGPGGFGENVTIAGADERTVCIGDTWRLGAATVQVSQPRTPCWKLVNRWQRPQLIRRVQESGRSGWYFRVLTEGFVAAGDDHVLLDRPHPEWTVHRATEVVHRRGSGAERATELLALAALPELAESWRGVLEARAANAGGG